ncbi:MAG TPA: DUF433 domain-containing protein [Chloroflexia bacterium]|nr:DUF433 domain-containing protein [Chloroflexia bacterium]
MLDTQTVAQLVTCDPEIVSGTPVFKGTRVPAKSLLEWLKGGYTLDEFLENFPSVEREQAEALLNLANELLLSQVK